MEFDQDQMVRVISLYFFCYFSLQFIAFLSSLIFPKRGGEPTPSWMMVLYIFIYLFSILSLGLLVLSSTGEGGYKIISVSMALSILVTVPASIGGQNIYENRLAMYIIPMLTSMFTLYATTS